ncbi:cyclic nucleotide-gated ion channel 20 [Spatholobus suberectus]|nr:cyclic nucleotide-gated ion channel 20 [Spatholobus suberectus]
MLSETRAQLSDEAVDSNFRRPVSRTRSASISIPMATLESYEKETSLVGHTGPLRSVRKTPFVQMSGPLYGTHGTGNLSRQIIRVNQCLRNACRDSNIPGCSTFMDCGSGSAFDEKSNLWKNNVNATACLNSSSGTFSYGIYVNAVQLTIETRVVNKYVFALFWGFQSALIYLCVG